MTGRELPEPIEAQVEFCTHSGGGRSPRTLKALWELVRAMAEDNADPMGKTGCVRYSGADFLATEGIGTE